MGALRPKLPCALVECASVYDALMGMCVHVGVPLMHSRGRCCVSPCCTSRGHSGCCQVSCCYCGSLRPKPRVFTPKVFPWQTGIKGTQKPLWLLMERHHNPSQAVMFVYVGHSAAAAFHHEAQGEDISPLALAHPLAPVEGGRDGWRDEVRGFPALLVCVSPRYLESLLMTRISAPFSSLRRWLSALRSTRTWRQKLQDKLKY